MAKSPNIIRSSLYAKRNAGKSVVQGEHNGGANAGS